MLARLLASPSGQRVDEVYSYDCSNNGDSAVLNRDLLGDTHSWIDHGRDAANFLISYLPPKNAREQPTLLPEQQVDPDLLQLDWREEKKPLHGSWRGHSLVAIGQSYGGAALTLAEVACPGLFSGASFLDAMLVHPIPEEHLDVASMFRANAAGGCLARRDQCVAFL